jgi:hypothetical protein
VALLLTLAIYVGCGYGPDELASSIEQTAKWYHKLTS